MYTIGKLYKKKTNSAIMLILSDDHYCLIKNIFGELVFQINKTELLLDNTWEELS